jgi:hypothetical protein
MHAFEHNNIALMATSFGHYGHHQASAIKKREKAG